LADSRLQPGQVEEKIWKEKTWCDPACWPSKTRYVDPARPGQKPDCNPLIFVFFTKTTSFWFKKKLTQATPSKPGTRALNQAGHQAGSKNYGSNNSHALYVDKSRLVFYMQ
jgi:hypothetical protein